MIPRKKNNSISDKTKNFKFNWDKISKKKNVSI